MLSKNFISLRKRVFCAAGPERVPKVKYFKRFLSDFNKQGLRWKLITTASGFEEKKIDFFFFKKLKFSQKMYFLRQFFFENFCFLPTFMFDFNKWGLKWKPTASYFEGKNSIFFLTWSFLQKIYFLTSIFFEEFYFLPIHMFDFNKKLLVLKKKSRYFSRTWNFL